MSSAQQARPRRQPCPHLLPREASQDFIDEKSLLLLPRAPSATCRQRFSRPQGLLPAARGPLLGVSVLVSWLSAHLSGDLMVTRPEMTWPGFVLPRLHL